MDNGLGFGMGVAVSQSLFYNHDKITGAAHPMTRYREKNQKNFEMYGGFDETLTEMQLQCYWQSTYIQWTCRKKTA